MKNIQVIDAALNCVYDIFAATDEEFAQIFPSSEDVAFIEVYARGEQAKLDEVFRLHGLAGTLRGIAHTSIRTQATVHIMGDVFSKWRDIIGTESLEKYLEGQQNLAAQFLAQFSARLPRESEALREIGDVIADYADAIGSLVATTTQIPGIGKLLAFDRKTIVEALEVAHQIDGEAYLEKIVQAPFPLPTIDQARMRTRLQLDLGLLIDLQDFLVEDRLISPVWGPPDGVTGGAAGRTDCCSHLAGLQGFSPWRETESWPVSFGKR